MKLVTVMFVLSPNTFPTRSVGPNFARLESRSVIPFAMETGVVANTLLDLLGANECNRLFNRGLEHRLVPRNVKALLVRRTRPLTTPEAAAILNATTILRRKRIIWPETRRNLKNTRFLAGKRKK